MKTPNERQLQQIATNDIDFKDFMETHKWCAAKPYFFLVNDSTFQSHDQKKTNRSNSRSRKKQDKALKSLELSEKHLPSMKDFISKRRLNLEIVDELKRIGEKEQKGDSRGLNKTCDFTKFKIPAYGNAIKNGIITMYMPNDEHNKFAKLIKEFKSKAKHIR